MLHFTHPAPWKKSEEFRWILVLKCLNLKSKLVFKELSYIQMFTSYNWPLILCLFSWGEVLFYLVVSVPKHSCGEKSEDNFLESVSPPLQAGLNMGIRLSSLGQVPLPAKPACSPFLLLKHLKCCLKTKQNKTQVNWPQGWILHFHYDTMVLSYPNVLVQISSKSYTNTSVTYQFPFIWMELNLPSKWQCHNPWLLLRVLDCINNLQ